MRELVILAIGIIVGCFGGIISTLIHKTVWHPKYNFILKDHILAQFTNELRDTAKKYHATQQLRSRISGIVSKYTKSADIRG